LAFSDEIASFFRLGGVDFQPAADGEPVEADDPLELLRLSIQARWTTIFERSEQTSMIRALWNVFEDLNTVVYVLRWDARVLSGTPRIAQMLTFVGPVGGDRRN
jgi:hypothetical protein